MPKETVNIIGGGIVGLMSAFYLNRAGFEVSVFDAGPNPLNDYNLARAGATFSGGDARHVSATETVPHATSSMTGQIHKGIIDGGWDAKGGVDLNYAERDWAIRFDQLTRDPDWISKNTATVAGVNNYSKALWRRLMPEEADLFRGTNVQSDITVYFLDRKTLESEAEAETLANPDFPIRVLTADEVKRHNPEGMTNPVERGIIVGGLIIDGFSINAISFCRNLIRKLDKSGTDFFWEARVDSLDEIPDSDYSFISTGAKKQKFLEGTNSSGSIMGVAGVWIRIPNPGLKGPIKIATPYPTGYINGTLEGNDLLLSGGYGFVGEEDEIGFESADIRMLLEDLERNIANVFPASYKSALAQESLTPRVCVRPMRADGLGVFEIMKGGKVIFAGANNAGGFTQAPVVAEAVLDTLNGKSHFLSQAYS